MINIQVPTLKIVEPEAKLDRKFKRKAATRRNEARSGVLPHEARNPDLRFRRYSEGRLIALQSIPILLVDPLASLRITSFPSPVQVAHHPEHDGPWVATINQHILDSSGCIFARNLASVWSLANPPQPLRGSS